MYYVFTGGIVWTEREIEWWPQAKKNGGKNREVARNDTPRNGARTCHGQKKIVFGLPVRPYVARTLSRGGLNGGKDRGNKHGGKQKVTRNGGKKIGRLQSNDDDENRK